MADSEFKKTEEPFRFYTLFNLSELTGVKASTLNQLLKQIKEATPSCIYYHTHRFLQIHQYLSPEPPNDFSYWVANVLREDELAEKLASIDTIQFSTLRELQNKIAQTIQDYLTQNPRVRFKFTEEGQEFHFIKSISFVLPTNYVAYNLRQFLQALKQISINSIYFHMFEARIRLAKGDNDFSFWIRNSLRKENLAEKISKLDPYTFTLEGLRNKLISLIKEEIIKGGQA